jgi:hypothetical protein
MLYLKSFGIWFLLLICAIIAGTFRQEILLPEFGELTAHQIGTIIFLIVQFVIIYFFIRKLKISHTNLLLKIGIFWVVMTIIFEFVFGHYVIGHPWQKLFADYNLLNGRIWILVLINNIAAPLICGKVLR